MPTISLSFPFLHNTPLTSYFLSNNNTNTNTTPTTQTTPTPTTTTTLSSSPPPLGPEKFIKPMDAVELRRVFDMFDQNGDGRITTSELTSSLRNMGIVIPEGDLANMIAQIDANGDGCVDGDEFRALYRLIMEERAESEEDVEEEDDMREAFNVFDKNGDGFISVDELRSVLGSLGLGQGRSLEECKLMIMKVDVDGDGRVSFNEFIKMMKEGGFAALSNN